MKRYKEWNYRPSNQDNSSKKLKKNRKYYNKRFKIMKIQLKQS